MHMPSKTQETLRKREQEKLRAWRRFTKYDLTAAMNTHTWSSQYFNIGRERASLTEELPAAASCWEKENLFQRVPIPMQRLDLVSFILREKHEVGKGCVRRNGIELEVGRR